MGETKGMDYADWAADVDFVSNDHYVRPGPAGPRRAVLLGEPDRQHRRRPAVVPHGALHQRGELAAGQRRQAAGELARDSLTHVAHGADAVCFFQWRQSRGGGGEVPLGDGAARRQRQQVFRDVTDLGRTLRELAASRAAGVYRHGPRSSSTGIPGGPASWTPIRATVSATVRRRSTGTRRSWPAASAPMSSRRRPPSTATSWSSHPSCTWCRRSCAPA